jgi:hypothetical protein
MSINIFFTIKDLMFLLGCDSYNSAQRQHKSVRKKLGKKKTHKLTIREYCDFEELDFDYVLAYLRGVPPPKAGAN